MTLTLANHDFWKTLDNSREFQIINRASITGGTSFDLVVRSTQVLAFEGKIFATGRAEMDTMYADTQTDIVQYHFVDPKSFSVNLILKPTAETLHVPTIIGPIAGLGVPPDPQVFINDGQPIPASYDNNLSIHNELTRNTPTDPYTY